ncbi:MAG TPA: glycosyltransferase [Cyclobacteriaceae bacterium]|nr:glycosyltransferase [Cyclobacteriaceae bacterium]
MKILHVTGYAVRGGCEKNCLHFIAGSPQYQHAVIVLGIEGPMSAEWRDAGARVDHLDILKENVIAFGSKLRKFIKGNKYDLVIAWSTIRLSMQLYAFDSATRDVRVYLGNPVGKNYRSVKDIVLSKIYRHSCGVELMACSGYVSRSYVASSYYSRYPIHISLNPVPVPSTKPVIAPDSSVLQAGMVARLDRIKDHATVLRAFAEVGNQDIKYHLHIVGNGEQMTMLTGLADSLKITNSVTFHGDVKDVYNYLRSWHIFTYATTPEEGLGSAVAEAMSNGLPCILSDLPMLRELAPGAEAVWFEAGNAQDLAEKVIALWKDPASRRQLSDKAYAHAERAFAVQRFINDYIDA